MCKTRHRTLICLLLNLTPTLVAFPGVTMLTDPQLKLREENAGLEPAVFQKTTGTNKVQGELNASHFW